MMAGCLTFKYLKIRNKVQVAMILPVKAPAFTEKQAARLANLSEKIFFIFITLYFFHDR